VVSVPFAPITPRRTGGVVVSSASSTTVRAGVPVIAISSPAAALPG
jgi:hypothetical protein